MKSAMKMAPDVEMEAADNAAVEDKARRKTRAEDADAKAKEDADENHQKELKKRHKAFVKMYDGAAYLLNVQPGDTVIEISKKLKHLRKGGQKMEHGVLTPANFTVESPPGHSVCLAVSHKPMPVDKEGIRHWAIQMRPGAHACRDAAGSADQE